MRFARFLACVLAALVAFSAFAQEPESCESLLRKKRYDEAKARADALIRFALASPAGAKDVRSVLRDAIECRSHASHGLGDARAAEWDEHVAAAFDGKRKTAPDADALPSAGPVDRPVLTTKVAPDYPERARALRLEQPVEIEVTIGADGLPSKPWLVSKRADPALAFAAFEAVKQWVFQPATREGKPVASLFRLKVGFKP